MDRPLAICTLAASAASCWTAARCVAEACAGQPSAWAIAAVCAAASASLLVCGSSMMLEHKREAYGRLWEDEAGAYAAFVEKAGHEPRCGAGGEEGMRHAWASDVRALSDRGDLTPSQAAIATRAGVGGLRAGCAETVWEIRRGPIACAAALAPAAVCAACATCSPAYATAALSCALVAAACAAICDATARIIPWETCLALAAAGLAWQAACAGQWGAAMSAVAACICAAALWGCQRAFPPGSIGGGDVRMLCATGMACGTGMAAASICMACIWAAQAAAARISGKATADDRVALGPSIAAGCAMGMAIPQLTAAFA